MDTVAQVFLVLLVMIAVMMLLSCVKFWYDAWKRRGTARQDYNRAVADALVAKVAKRQAQHSRVTFPLTARAAQKQWLAKHRTGVPPEHKKYGRRAIHPGVLEEIGSPIEEQPIAEDMPPSPASGYIPISYEPILARKRTPSMPRVVTADVHESGSAGPSTSIPMQPLSQPPLSVQLPMRRSVSPIGPGGVPVYRKSRTPPHGGPENDPGPKSGQLPQRKRSKSRESSGSGSSGYQPM